MGKMPTVSLSQTTRRLISKLAPREPAVKYEPDMLRGKVYERYPVWVDFMLQEGAEFAEWLVLLAEIDARQGIEIGTGRGGSACLTLEVLPGLNRIISIDAIDRSKEMAEAARPLLGKLALIEGESQKFATRDAVTAMLQDKPADFLFIDGNHAYESVAADFYFYAPLVRPGGLIGLHDIASVGLGYEHTAGVERFWKELRGREPDRCQSIERHFGIGVFKR